MMLTHNATLSTNAHPPQESGMSEMESPMTPTVEGGMYAMGYAQAEDRPEQLLMNLAAAMGESARYAGKGGIQSDTVAKMFRLYETSVEEADTIREDVRDHVQAFVDGMNAWYAVHPEDGGFWNRHPL